MNSNRFVIFSLSPTKEYYQKASNIVYIRYIKVENYVGGAGSLSEYLKSAIGLSEIFLFDIYILDGERLFCLGGSNKFWDDNPDDLRDYVVPSWVKGSL